MGGALAFASPRLRDHENTVLAAVGHRGWALQMASSRLQAHREVCGGCMLIPFLASFLKYHHMHHRITVVWINSSPFIIFHPMNIKVVLAACQQDGSALLYASEALKADRGVVLAAVATYGSALNWASPELQNDKDVVRLDSYQCCYWCCY